MLDVMENNVKVIGVTGGTGCGKSRAIRTAVKMKECLNISTDIVAKQLMQKGNISYNLVVEHFGKDILDKNKNIDRKKLASIVFSNKNELEALNSFTHPYVIEYVKNLIKQEKEKDYYDYIFVESALLFDTDLWKLCDETWNIAASKDIRIERLTKYRGYSKKEAEAIIRNQKPENYYVEKCTRTILNNNIQDLTNMLSIILIGK